MNINSGDKVVIKRIYQSAMSFVVIVLLFMAAMNFQAKFFYFAFGAAFVCLLGGRKIELNKFSLVYFLLGLLLALYSFSGGVKVMLRFFSCVLLYLVGYNFVSYHSNKKTAEKGYLLLVVISLGSYSHYIMNYLLNINEEVGRNTIDIWSKEVWNATGQSALACLMIGLSVAWLLCPKRKIMRLFSILAFVGVFLYSLILAGRTVFALIALGFVIGFLFLLLNQKKLSDSIKLISIVLGLILLIFVLITLNVGGIKDIIIESNLYQRFQDSSLSDLLNTGRSSRKEYFLKNMHRHPWGGLHMRTEVGYAHDLLLDAYDEFGIFAFLLLVAILLKGLLGLFKLCCNRSVSLCYRMAFLCIYAVVLLEFCVEPILAGMPWLFIWYCLINGLIDGINNRHRKAKFT